MQYFLFLNTVCEQPYSLYSISPFKIKSCFLLLIKVRMFSFNINSSADLPSAPLEPKVIPQTLTSVVLSWLAPRDSPCVFSYIITVISIGQEGSVSIAYTTTSNTTNIRLFNMKKKLGYIFTVAGVENGGRVGKLSSSSEIITLDGKLKLIKVGKWMYTIYIYLYIIHAHI